MSDEQLRNGAGIAMTRREALTAAMALMGALAVPGLLVGCTPDGRGGVVRELVERDGRLLGDDQRMAATERADVEESEDLVVLVNLVARHLASQDLRENRLGHGRHLSPRRWSLTACLPWSLSPNEAEPQVRKHPR